ncbi:hypothetical protein SCANM63S_05222 [Streptomyces canarius]
MTVTLADVAARAQVSPATVSRVLNGNYPAPRPPASGCCARWTSWTTSSTAPPARSPPPPPTWSASSSTTSPTRSSGSWRARSRRRSGARAGARAANASRSVCNTGGSPERELTYLTLLQRQRAAAVVLTGGAVEDAPHAAAVAAKLRKLADARTRVVLCGRPPAPDTEAVALTFDNRGGARELTDHLIGLGHAPARLHRRPRGAHDHPAPPGGPPRGARGGGHRGGPALDGPRPSGTGWYEAVMRRVDRRGAGYRELVLWTNDVLGSARRLYQRHGFVLGRRAAPPLLRQGPGRPGLAADAARTGRVTHGPRTAPKGPTASVSHGPRAHGPHPASDTGDPGPRPTCRPGPTACCHDPVGQDRRLPPARPSRPGPAAPSGTPQSARTSGPLRHAPVGQDQRPPPARPSRPGPGARTARPEPATHDNPDPSPTSRPGPATDCHHPLGQDRRLTSPPPGQDQPFLPPSTKGRRLPATTPPAGTRGSLRPPPRPGPAPPRHHPAPTGQDRRLPRSRPHLPGPVVPRPRPSPRDQAHAPPAPSE